MFLHARRRDKSFIHFLIGSLIEDWLFSWPPVAACWVGRWGDWELLPYSNACTSYNQFQAPRDLWSRKKLARGKWTKPKVVAMKDWLKSRMWCVQVISKRNRWFSGETLTEFYSVWLMGPRLLIRGGCGCVVITTAEHQRNLEEKCNGSSLHCWLHGLLLSWIKLLRHFMELQFHAGFTNRLINWLLLFD